MKSLSPTRVLLPLAFVLLLCGPASAGGAFLGVSAGSTETEIDTIDFPDLDADDSGWKLWGGYDIINLFGIEVGYADLGEWSESITTNPGMAPDTYTGDFSAFYGAAVGQITFLKIVTIFGKVGIASVDQEVRKNSGIPESDGSETVSLYGVGVGIEILGKVQIRLEYEIYDADSESLDKTEFASIGARWNF